jgi:hypothetical protein
MVEQQNGKPRKGQGARKGEGKEEARKVLVEGQAFQKKLGHKNTY